MAETTEQIMQCMEVWGGNAPVDAGVALTGLDACVHCRPHKQAAEGGDVYYVSSCATGRIARLLLADVSGHGISVASVATKLRALMRRYVNFLDQSALVRELNGQFSALTTDGLFATALAMTFFAPTRTLTICNAGHPPPLIYRAAEQRWEYLSGDGTLPWGVDETSSYTQFNIQLDVNDLVLCYTDFLPEARSREGKFLGMEALLRLMQTLPQGEPATMIAALLNCIRSEGYQTDDDVTLLLFRPNGKAKSAGILQKLSGMGRGMRALLGSLRPGGEPMPWPDFTVATIGGAILPPLNRVWAKKKIKS